MSNTPGSANQWSETESNLFLNLAEIFVPSRAEQTSVLLQLIPAETNEACTIVELAAGEGGLAEAILEGFPHCHYIALHGSERVRAHMRQRPARVCESPGERPFVLAGAALRAV